MTRAALSLTALLLATAAAPAPEGHAPAAAAPRNHEGQNHAGQPPAGQPPAAQTHAAPVPPAGHGDHGPAARGSARARPAPFAAALAERPLDDDAKPLPVERGWAALIRSTPDTRQARRWDLAHALIAAGRIAEAEGVLAVMRSDEPDLGFVPAWQRARGAVAARLGRDREAMALLSGTELAGNAEACAWRMRILAAEDLHRQAVSEFRCAIPAIDRRPLRDRAPFLLAAADMALAIGAPKQALSLLTPLADRDAAANLLRGRAMIALENYDEGRLRIERARHSGSAPVKAAAELALIEAEQAAGTLSVADARRRLDALLFRWRGDRVEQGALMLTQTLAETDHDLRGTLKSAATLFRHFDLGDRTRPTLEKVQALLAGLIRPGSPLPLPEAAGLYWEYRDLAPTGAAGDALAATLAQRLADAGLPARAAELLTWQMDNRAADVAKGPVSVRIAELHIMAGRPDRALQVIRDSEGPHYPDAMLDDRRRVQAIALFRMGKRSEALALAELIADAAPVRAEMLWQARDWKGFAAANRAALPAATALSADGETRVLRHAVALALTGDEAGLNALRGRYLKAFAGRKSATAFRMLTGAPDGIEPGAIDAALAAMPPAAGGAALGALLTDQG